MAKFDVIDEAIINAEPAIVYETLLAEYAGRTNWWMPHLEAKVRDGRAPDEPGALVEITVHGTTTKCHGDEQVISRVVSKIFEME